LFLPIVVSIFTFLSESKTADFMHLQERRRTQWHTGPHKKEKPQQLQKELLRPFLRNNITYIPILESI